MIEIINIFAGIATIFGFPLAVYQLWSDRKRSRQMATLEAYEKLQTEAFDVLNKWRPSEITEVCKDRQSDTYKDLSAALARIEHFCVGLNNKVYDMKIFYKIAHGYFDEGGSLYRRILPLMENKLASAKEDYFKNIHDVWKAMKKRG